MKPTSLILSLILGAFSTLVAEAAPPAGPDQQVGAAGDGGMVVPSGQRVRPAGRTLEFPGMPVDLALSPDGKALFIKNIKSLAIVDLGTWSIRQELPFVDKERGSMHGLAAWADEQGVSHVLVTCAKQSMMEAISGDDGAFKWKRSIVLRGPADTDAHATGVVVSADRKRAFVCLSRNNTLGVVDLEAGKLLAEIAVGICPYDVVLDREGSKAFVSNFGGRRTKAGEKTEQSTGTQVPVDGRSINISGTVSVVDLVEKTETRQIEVGLHPAQMRMTADGSTMYVACANSDAISVIDLKRSMATGSIAIRPDEKLPFGSIPNALLLSEDGKTLWCANAGNNAVANIALGADAAAAKIRGFVPTGWFPGAIESDGRDLFVANVKGAGSRAMDAKKQHFNSHQVLGSVTRVGIAEAEGELKAMTQQVRADAGVPASLRAMERAATGVKPTPVPARWGEPSPIKHVIYVLKENRTYDQVFGDMSKGNNEPKLCTFGRKVSPNHHALAEQFALLDNYYCSGVNSADGHQWAMQGIVTDYQIKESGGNTRSYDFGTDALCYAASDFIWDSLLLAGLSFRNYGEYDFPTITSGQKGWFDVYRDWDAGKVKFKQSIELEALRKYTCAEYPGWLMDVPDVCRMKVFLKEFEEFKKRGEFPNFVIVYLPQDHTQGKDAGAPTARSHVADNDLALGQLVEAISNSPFWESSMMFVNEDDPQDGFDHVDGHRSICLVVGPYVKRGTVVSKFYNQSSVLHTITRMLGAPPLNQMVGQAPTMEACFTDKADLTPYKCLMNQTPIDEPNTVAAGPMTEEERELADAARHMDFSRPDRNNDDLFNRILWHEAHPKLAYPKEFSGAHGKGLAKLGLKLDVDRKDDDDDDK